MKRSPWIDRWIGHLLMRRGTWLLKHGNSHEGRHYYAALLAGDSTDCERGANCTLDRVWR